MNALVPRARHVQNQRFPYFPKLVSDLTCAEVGQHTLNSEKGALERRKPYTNPSPPTNGREQKTPEPKAAQLPGFPGRFFPKGPKDETVRAPAN